MRPEDHIDENLVPTEENFAPEHSSEKEELLKSIRKNCRVYIIFYSILAIIFAINGIVHFDDVSETKLYMCPLVALMLVFTLIMVFYAVIYNRISQSSTASEMQHFLKLLGPDSRFSKLIIIVLTLCFMMAGALRLLGYYPWYVIILAALGIAICIGGLWWLLKRSGKGDPNDMNIKKLQALEEKEKQSLQETAE